MSEFDLLVVLFPVFLFWFVIFLISYCVRKFFKGKGISFGGVILQNRSENEIRYLFKELGNVLGGRVTPSFSGSHQVKGDNNNISYTIRFVSAGRIHKKSAILIELNLIPPCTLQTKSDGVGGANIITVNGADNQNNLLIKTDKREICLDYINISPDIGRLIYKLNTCDRTLVFRNDLVRQTKYISLKMLEGDMSSLKKEIIDIFNDVIFLGQHFPDSYF